MVLRQDWLNGQPVDNVVMDLIGSEVNAKRGVAPRVIEEESDATPIIDLDTTDAFGLTAQAVPVTFTWTGSPGLHQPLWIYIVATGSIAITWDTDVFERGPVPLPTVTVGTERMDVGFVFNGATGKLRCVASGSG